MVKSIISSNLCETLCHDIDNNVNKQYNGWVLSLKCDDEWSALMLKKDKSNIDISNLLDYSKNLHIVKLYKDNNEIAKIEYITDYTLNSETCALFSPLSQNAYDILNLSNIKKRVDNNDHQIIGIYDIIIESS